jgi:hypothetical protein
MTHLISIPKLTLKGNVDLKSFMAANARSMRGFNLPSDIGFGENLNAASAVNSKSKFATNRTVISALAWIESPRLKLALIE